MYNPADLQASISNVKATGQVSLRTLTHLREELDKLREVVSDGLEGIIADERYVDQILDRYLEEEDDIYDDSPLSEYVGILGIEDVVEVYRKALEFIDGLIPRISASSFRNLLAEIRTDIGSLNKCDNRAVITAMITSCSIDAAIAGRDTQQLKLLQRAADIQLEELKTIVKWFYDLYKVDPKEPRDILRATKIHPDLRAIHKVAARLARTYALAGGQS